MPHALSRVVCVSISVSLRDALLQNIVMRVYINTHIYVQRYCRFRHSALPVCHYGIFNVNTAINHVDSGLLKQSGLDLSREKTIPFFALFQSAEKRQQLPRKKILSKLS